MGYTLRTLVKWFHGSKRFNFMGSWSALDLIGDAARVGYFVPLNSPLNGHPPNMDYTTAHVRDFGLLCLWVCYCASFKAYNGRHTIAIHGA